MTASTNEYITDRFIDRLEHGAIPWRKPWKASTNLPRNLATKQNYRGINVFLLLDMDCTSPFWATLRQVTELGGRIRKGERPCPVVFSKKTTIEDQLTGGPKEIFFLRCYHVFNVAQCDGIEQSIPLASASASSNQNTLPPALQAEEIVNHMPQRPAIKYGVAKSDYSAIEDVVSMPRPDQFDRAEDYYGALFRELVHSTGHGTRLKRHALAGTSNSSPDPYSEEDLIADLGAALLCGYAEIGQQTPDNQAAYRAGWIARFRADHNLVIRAAAKAQRAVDFILGKAHSHRQPAEKGVRHEV